MPAMLGKQGLFAPLHYPVRSLSFPVLQDIEI